MACTKAAPPSFSPLGVWLGCYREGVSCQGNIIVLQVYLLEKTVLVVGRFWNSARRPFGAHSSSALSSTVCKYQNLNNTVETKE